MTWEACDGRPKETLTSNFRSARGLTPIPREKRWGILLSFRWGRLTERAGLAAQNRKPQSRRITLEWFRRASSHAQGIDAPVYNGYE